MPTALPRPEHSWAHPLLGALSVFAPSVNEPDPGPLVPGAVPSPSDAVPGPAAVSADLGAGQGDLLTAILSVHPTARATDV
ncbi:hypothetical protein OG252_35320 [Streptomyces sp. NBC_01352]|uniref:hypothetical protein n=1 Tax=unclassified Streptomyces TaxID=2593676 RepID=UPI002E3175E9|nr:hypothetical protein [Streptomyces sp. NBC_01352]